MFTRYLFKKYIKRYLSRFKKRRDDAASGMPELPKNILMGFWHNWGPEPGQGYQQGMFKEMSLSEVPEAYNVVAVAFMKGNGIPTFKPYKGTDAEFRAEVAKLNAQGRAVLISLGGADAHIELHAGQEAALAAEICRLVEVYGFDGLDIDLEQTAITYADNATVLPAALKLVRKHYETEGKHFIISMAPEFPYLRDAGAYLDYVSALEAYYDFIAPQYYNQGGDGIWVDELNAWITQNNDDQKREFLYYLTDSLIHGTRGFSSIPADRLVIGLPSNNDGAATGYVIDPEDVNDALVALESDGNPIRGLMTWSINWDDGIDKNGTPYNWEFHDRYKYLTEIEQPEPDEPPAPAGLTSSQQTTTSITLSWSLSEWEKPVLRYDLYRDGVHVGETARPPFVDEDLQPGTLYTYYVTATDSEGATSKPSDELSVGTKTESGEDQRPTAPSDLHTTEITANSISIMWNASSPGTHPIMEYAIIRNEGQIAAVKAPATTFTDTGLTANTPYQYVVFTRDTANMFSSPSNILKTSTKPEDGGGEISDWVVDHSYKIDELARYEGIVYICIQAHVSNPAWTPTAAFTLWSPYALRGDRRKAQRR
ncbi:fibronectin type III domain-containing protein [Pseudomonas triticifolii]|uniref:chitinase n=1 Tax=Pseudomonas triticifolii TaxID=2762592 RepID=A0ABR7BFR7_9PSED|nr:glycosyl hydrolase family 18 protein [Pseudomonas triticifolii]MBC3955745.1 fibronectin type III domain-containing protein [Pseudomonas triticifolii]